MSIKYDLYLEQHIENVKNAFNWLVQNLPTKLTKESINHLMNMDHDSSKWSPDEYDAYDNYFYGNKSAAVKDAFNKAWLHHIHANPHHWQHWVLIEDDPTNKEGFICVEMPEEHALEMIADWWSFSWSKGDLREIFKWYDDHKSKMKLHQKTRKYVETVLSEIAKILDEKETV